jgi:tetratricopeptide (TPR) repeat protein
MPFGVKPVGRGSGQGLDSKPEGVDFDVVYDELVKRALELAGCEPFRADEEAAAGDIRTDMFFELATAEFVVADISSLNPNVFYELGIRHGVAPRGVLLLHGGWSRRPFDVAPDRTISYDGGLFTAEGGDPDERKARVAAEAARLGVRMAKAIADDDKTIGSPVYKELKGLVPADPSQIEIARARYFGTQFVDWRSRIRSSQAKGHAGDILTLARDAPNRRFAQELTLAAARSLVAMQRFEPARDVLLELLEEDAGDAPVLCELGQVLGRLHDWVEAERRLQQAAQLREGDPESHGMLGRVHKDRWRARWAELPDEAERRRVAGAQSALAEAAIRSYESALRRDLGAYYTSINVLALRTLLSHIGAEPDVADQVSLGDLVSVVRVSARYARDRAERGTGDAAAVERIWSTATLAELELLVGDGGAAVRLYQKASTPEDVTAFQIDSMLTQLGLYELLGFRSETVARIVSILEESRRFAVGAPVPRPGKVAVCSGHMIDALGRAEPRFPPEKEPHVRDALKETLLGWGIGSGDLGICGGARGADILFAELCLELGATVRLLLPLPIGDFLESSVRLSGTDWEDRFYTLKAQCEVLCQPERLGRPPAHASPHERNNLWCLDTARVEGAPGSLHVAVVWDERPSGDGPGGTSHFVKEARRLNARLRIMNPTRL